MFRSLEETTGSRVVAGNLAPPPLKAKQTTATKARISRVTSAGKHHTHDCDDELHVDLSGQREASKRIVSWLFKCATVPNTSICKRFASPKINQPARMVATASGTTRSHSKRVAAETTATKPESMTRRIPRRPKINLTVRWSPTGSNLATRI